MSIVYYSGTGGGPTVNIESAKELHEALDILHTQVMDNIGSDSSLLGILEQAMERLEMEHEVDA